MKCQQLYVPGQIAKEHSPKHNGYVLHTDTSAQIYNVVFSTVHLSKGHCPGAPGGGGGGGPWVVVVVAPVYSVRTRNRDGTTKVQK